MPVPIGIVASSVVLPARTSPLTTSFSVPSPPTATTRVVPSRADSSASSISWPGRSEKRVSPSSPRCAARFASEGQRFPAPPLPEAGLTRKTVSALMGRDGREGDAGHPVDRRAQLFVGDSLEDALDDDVGYGEEAAAVDAWNLVDAA